MRAALATATLSLLLLLTACGDDAPSATVSTTATSTIAPSTSVPLTTVRASTTAPPTTASPATTPAVTAAAPTTPAPTTTPPTTVDPGRIEVDADTDPVRTVPVPLGTPVTLVVRSATAEEFHLHGYDLELTGSEVTFQFTADQAGTFELETHDSGRLVVILQVG
jgi:ferric-dicitrate binding protein FerR (iron transport regulator)